MLESLDLHHGTILTVNGQFRLQKPTDRVPFNVIFYKFSVKINKIDQMSTHWSFLGQFKKF